MGISDDNVSTFDISSGVVSLLSVPDCRSDVVSDFKVLTLVDSSISGRIIL